MNKRPIGLTVPQLREVRSLAKQRASRNAWWARFWVIVCWTIALVMLGAAVGHAIQRWGGVR